MKDRRVAEALSDHKLLGDEDARYSAGPFLSQAFARAGYSGKGMADFINRNWTAGQADALASYIKSNTDIGFLDVRGRYGERYFEDVEAWAEANKILYPNGAA